MKRENASTSSFIRLNLNSWKNEEGTVVMNNTKEFEERFQEASLILFEVYLV